MKFLASISTEKSGAFMGMIAYMGAGILDFIQLDSWLQAFALGIFGAAGGALGKCLFDWLKSHFVKRKAP